MWKEILNQNDLDNFMEMLYGFHDSCLKELNYMSGAYVNESFEMYPINNQRILKVIIQRQFQNPCAIEMEFIGLKHLIMYPNDPYYTCEILDATMILKDDCIYWCDCGGLSESDLKDYEGTLICASKVRWRSADEYIGQKEIYTSPTEKTDCQ